ncbi:selenide, water dikinase SelD [Nodosilinea sp. P-1105]|uniref:selenide, water dikinase SelD n=1 Tax=Nodosilinea sp. P-1105 TaxID=2546229 RepID=UPI00146CBD71|nr:selenide, water dikinase SelD [Nodosilinea sp. P-1105]NMF82541.1 selenide, water dikinase SelD [Nodosilinea sp. P-1105]
MMQAEVPISTDVVLVGGGHTHALVLRQLAMVPLPGVRLTLITDLVDTPYSGMLPCHVSGRYGFDESHIDLRPLTQFARCRLLIDRAVGLDMANQRVLCGHHPPVSFDLLSIDTGSTPKTVAVPGAAEYAIAAKPVPHLLRHWQQVLDQVRQSPTTPITLAVVGGGVGGVELTLAMEERLHRLLQQLGVAAENLTIHLFHRGAALAPGRNRWTRRRLGQIMAERGIQLHLNEAVTAITQDPETGQRVIRGESGLSVRGDRVFWVTSATAPEWLQGSGLSLDDQGFIQVGDTLQTLSHPNVFAAGDVATMVNHPRPKAGVFAVRQAKPLCRNLLRHLRGEPLKPFYPQREFLTLIDVGYGKTIACRGPFAVETRLARWWKDRIDQSFMDKFRDLPPAGPMSSAPTPSSTSLTTSPLPHSPTPPCAGCGSKVGSDALTAALQQVKQDFPERQTPDNNLLIGLDPADDAAVVTVPPGVAMVHTVDFFPALINDQFVFAQICLKHCLGDLYAMGAKPQTVLAIVQIPYATATKQADTLYPLLAGIQTGLLATGATLAGGHTIVGPQLALGFACNGLADPARLWRKGGMQPGDVLILTQPLGTGTLFAADMQYRAKGRWIEAAIAAMLTPNQGAADTFRTYQATACTDITGFGLLGHLLEMAQAAGVAVALELDTLPILPGARETLAQEFVSSLYAQNLAAARALADAARHAQHPDYPLLFDPQTAGGLLAAVPAATAEACLERLCHQGYTAAKIGYIMDTNVSSHAITIQHWG